MSYEDRKRPVWHQWESDEADEWIARRSVSPGKRTLTMSLPPRSVSLPASAQAPVQQKADPASDMQRNEQAALTEQWMEVALRPDLQGAPVQRKRIEEERREEPLSLSAGSGQPMPEEVQTKMERAFGTDFSAVRIHEGPQATTMGALAYTQGADIHFAPGQYNPSDQRGQELLGHELTHVVQQNQGRVRATTQAKGVAINDDSSLEREADELGGRAARGEIANPRGRNPESVVLPGVAPGAHGAIQAQRDPATCDPDMSTTGVAASIASDPLGSLLASLLSARTPAERQAATAALTDWCRDNLIDQNQLSRFRQSALDATEKTRILGELRVAIARNEFLLGWSHEGGVTSGEQNGWENTSANHGTFPDYYMEEVETAGRQSGNPPWCTSFAGHTATRLGFEAEPGSDATSMFWSGYRLDLWAREGESNAGTQMTPHGQRVAAGTGGSARIGGDTWAILYQELSQLHDSRSDGQSDEEFRTALGQAVDNFFANNPTPQAGDMIVYDDNNRISGSSHTNMVERYDASTHTIYTIGGNEGHAVGGRRVVLTDREQVHRLAALVRLGADFYTRGSAQPAAGATPPGGDGGMTPAPASAAEGANMGAELLRQARDINQRIAEVMHCLNQIQSGDTSATVLEWQTGSVSSDASSSDH